MLRERRWIILTTDGRHSTLGRSAPPDEEEVAKAASALAAIGLAGWYAILDGDYWARRASVALTMIQPLAHATDGDWVDAVAAFDAARKSSLATTIR